MANYGKSGNSGNGSGTKKGSKIETPFKDAIYKKKGG